MTLGDDSHQWLSDVPAALGGGDSGPSPHEILLSALGACTAITVAMYAQRKEWPLEGIDVQLNIVEERTKPEPFTHIRRDIRLAGDLDAEQRQRLLEIANACPIHRVLSGEVSVSSQLRD